MPPVEETAGSFDGNARLKAEALLALAGPEDWVLADDSGLEVDALGGAPGVFSARYAGEPCDYAANNEKILRELAGEQNRRARFVTVIALCRPGAAPLTVTGTCEGTIIEEPRGSKGFGYDPLFVPDGYSETFAELPSEVKNKISHRANALMEASNHWKYFFQALDTK
jgi:XTP/dITP diphosphohydrolase